MTDLNDIDTIYKPYENTCFSVKRSFYKNNTQLDANSLNNYILDNYNYYPLPINDETLNNCRPKAIENNKDYFLLRGISSNQEPNNDNINKYQTTCLIPKYDTKCDMSNLNQLLEPIDLKVKELINEESPISSNNIHSISISDFNNLNESEGEFNKSCFEINDINNLFLAKDNNLVLYKIDTILNDNDIVGKLGQVKSYQYYNEKLQNDFNKEDFEEDLNRLKNSFENYICNPKASNYRSDFDGKMINLKDNYDSMFSILDSISSDISTVHFLTKNDTKILKNIQEQINEKKIKLKEVLGFDGASNGKLNDTNFMKNLKLSETLILFLIIVSLIFIYSKKK